MTFAQLRSIRIGTRVTLRDSNDNVLGTVTANMLSMLHITWDDGVETWSTYADLVTLTCDRTRGA